MTNEEQKLVLAQIEESWGHHPRWGIGKLISSSASISRGQLMVNPVNIDNAEIMSGLRALIPDSEEGKKVKKLDE